MKLSYDKETDSLYIHLSNTPSVDSDKVADGVVLDFDGNGTLVGINTPARRPIFKTKNLKFKL